MKKEFYHKTAISLVISFLFVNLISTQIYAQNLVSDFFPDIKILESNNPSPGYFFIAAKGLTAPDASLYIAIVDNYGTPVFFRKMSKPSGYLRMLLDGRIANMNGVPRKLYVLNDMLETDIVYAIQGYKPNGHDWANDLQGNILLMGEASSHKDMSSLIAGGNVNAEVLDVVVQEFDKDGNLKYTWNSADHFDIFDGNENSPYLDYTTAQLDYVHANSITVDSDTSFLLSSRHMDEITKVDRRTGDIIWRLGGKHNEFTFINDPIGFSHQHSLSKLENGDLSLFDNGNLHEEQVSTALVYHLDETNKTATLVQRTGRTPAVFCRQGSGVQRLSNGNTLIFWGLFWPSATEFHPDGSVALEIDFTEHSFSPGIHKFLWETNVFETDKDSIYFGQVEDNNATQNTVSVTNNKSTDLVLTGFSGHSNLFEIAETFPITIGAGQSLDFHVQFNSNLADKGVFEDVLTLSSDSDTERIARQIWVFAEKMNNLTAIDYLNVENAAFSASPIPAKGVLYIQCFSKDEKSFELFSITGQSLFKSQNFTENRYSLDISKLKSGVYFIVVTNQKTKIADKQKIIIQN